MLSRREAPEMGKKCVVGWPGKRVDDARVVGADTIDGPTCVTWNNASLAVILRVQYAGCPADPRGDSGGTTQFRLHSVCEGAATNTNLSFLFFCRPSPHYSSLRPQECAHQAKPNPSHPEGEPQDVQGSRSQVRVPAGLD